METLKHICNGDVPGYLRMVDALGNGTVTPCPACGRDTWLADIPHQDHQTLQRWSNVVESDRGARLRVILVCAHCGFVREHDAQAVLNWKEDGNG